MYAEFLGYPARYGESAWIYYQGTQWRASDGKPIHSWMAVLKAHCIRAADWDAKLSRAQVLPEMLRPTEEEVMILAQNLGGDEETAHQWFKIVTINGWKDARGRPIADWKAHLAVTLTNKRNSGARTGTGKEQERAIYLTAKNGDVVAVAERVGSSFVRVCPDDLGKSDKDAAIVIVAENPLPLATAMQMCSFLDHRVSEKRGKRTMLIAPVSLIEFGERMVLTDHVLARQQIMQHMLTSLKEKRAQN